VAAARCDRVVAIVGGILANGQNIAFLGRAGVRRRAIGHMRDDPVLAVLEAFQHHGRAVQHLRRGLGSAVLLIILRRPSPGRHLEIKTVNFHWFRCSNPGPVSIPAVRSFRASSARSRAVRGRRGSGYAEMEVRRYRAGSERADVVVRSDRPPAPLSS